MKKLALLLSSAALGASLLVLGPAAYTSADQTWREGKPSPAAAAAPLSEQPPEASVSANANAPAAPSSVLREAVSGFVSELAKQPGFENWSQAEWTSQPLGPGTHGWVILLKAGGQEIGYLIVYADENGGYRLTEYGRGNYPLFSQQTLYQSLVRLELIEYAYRAEPYYYNPLQAVWQVTVENADRVWYIDAKTGEELPFMSADSFPEPSFSMKPFTTAGSLHTIIQASHTSPVDPYGTLSWVQGIPAAGGGLFESLQAQIKAGTPPVYAAELYDGQVTIPLAVSGYQVWSGGDRFVQVVQDDDRYLPLDVLTRLGHFYP
ncbi:hypothetical protein SAMN02799630_00935 [Paenibacillus sp. UNCCL117]|uniref:hypothetical protein n=1 Tax=unclassified Paenibacillus TaxID=185978 RepID=UPI000882526A|nr:MULTISPECIES: hypothetical protein [unclassified Paenibacillus]SDC25788.1 hypothetical protein SAMN04488602_101737 [Paenibacillus sp. cl123]SFW19916.1 hypothetical protein SAMN02799630_00935 [Paenibacillus sp. UNCCL117]